MHPNVKAFLDTIAVSEGTFGIGEDGYNVLVGSLPTKPLLFHSYADHPRILNKKMRSTAAGRYQLLARYFDPYKERLGLPDFSPASQDAIAIQQIKEQLAFNDIKVGRFARALVKCSNIWASFPGAGYGQHENTLGRLEKVYKEHGGVIC